MEADEDLPQRLTIEAFNTRYSVLLRAVVLPQNGYVNYSVLISNYRDELVALVEEVAKPRTFASDSQRLAFLINAHNLLVMHAAASRYPISSVRDVPAFLSLPMPILGRELSADDIRDQLIRPMGDPRVHMALNIASAGSPPLLNTAYTAERLDEQLNTQAQRYVNGRSRSIVLPGQLLIPELFDWFAADFGQPPFEGVRDFLGVYAGPGTSLSNALDADPPLVIGYLEFNWTLNSSR